MTEERLRAELEAAGAELAEADRVRARARERVAAALEAADGTISIREMSRLAGVTRVTAYRLLGRDPQKAGD